MMEAKGNARVNAEFLASPSAPSKSAMQADRRAFLARKYDKREWAAPECPNREAEYVEASKAVATRPSLGNPARGVESLAPLQPHPPQTAIRAPLPPEPAPAFPTLPVPQRNAFARRLTSEEMVQTADLFAFAASPCRSTEQSLLISFGESPCRSMERSPLIGFGNAGGDWLEGW